MTPHSSRSGSSTPRPSSPRPSNPRPSDSGPLLISTNTELSEEVFRLAAVAGCDVESATDVAFARSSAHRAPLVLLDEEAAFAAAAHGVERRRVVILHRGSPSPELWRVAFEIGAERTFDLPAHETAFVDFLTEAVDGSAHRSGHVVAMLGGRGGAGASVLAAGTAITAARRGEQCLLVDCDPVGGGLDLVLGTESASGLRWSELTVSGPRVASGALRQALQEHRVGNGVIRTVPCDRDGPSSGLTAEAVRAVLDAGRRCGETVVCDLPRHLSESTAAVLGEADLTVVVVPAEVRACAAVARLVTHIDDVVAGRMAAVVRGPAPGGLKVVDVERATGLEVLTAMRAQPGLPAALDRGGACSSKSVMRGPLPRTAREVLAALSAESTRGSLLAVA